MHSMFLIIIIFSQYSYCVINLLNLLAGPIYSASEFAALVIWRALFKVIHFQKIGKYSFEYFNMYQSK